MTKSWRLSHNDEWMHYLDEKDREQFYIERHALMVPYLLGIIEKLSKRIWPEDYEGEENAQV